MREEIAKSSFLLPRDRNRCTVHTLSNGAREGVTEQGDMIGMACCRKPSQCPLWWAQKQCNALLILRGFHPWTRATPLVGWDHQLRLKKCLGDFVLASFWRALVVWSPHLPPVFGFCFWALRSLPISAADLRPLLHSSPLHLSMSSITTKAGLVLPSRPCKPTAEWGTFWRGRGSSRSDQRSATISEACQRRANHARHAHSTQVLGCVADVMEPGTQRPRRSAPITMCTTYILQLA
jgi:hypothetical protein